MQLTFNYAKIKMETHTHRTYLVRAVFNIFFKPAGESTQLESLKTEEMWTVKFDYFCVIDGQEPAQDCCIKRPTPLEPRHCFHQEQREQVLHD